MLAMSTETNRTSRSAELAADLTKFEAWLGDIKVGEPRFIAFADLAAEYKAVGDYHSITNFDPKNIFHQTYVARYVAVFETIRINGNTILGYSKERGELSPRIRELYDLHHELTSKSNPDTAKTVNDIGLIQASAESATGSDLSTIAWRKMIASE